MSDDFSHEGPDGQDQRGPAICVQCAYHVHNHYGTPLHGCVSERHAPLSYVTGRRVWQECDKCNPDGKCAAFDQLPQPPPSITKLILAWLLARCDDGRA